MDPDGQGDLESFFQKLTNLYNLQAAVDQIAAGITTGGPRFILSEVLGRVDGFNQHQAARKTDDG